MKVSAILCDEWHMFCCEITLRQKGFKDGIMDSWLGFYLIQNLCNIFMFVVCQECVSVHAYICVCAHIFVVL